MFSAAATPSLPIARQERKPGFLTRLMHLDAVWRQQQDLRNLDDHMLRDIGLSRAEARTETERPAWDAPAYWF